MSPAKKTRPAQQGEAPVVSLVPVKRSTLKSLKPWTKLLKGLTPIEDGDGTVQSFVVSAETHDAAVEAWKAGKAVEKEITERLKPHRDAIAQARAELKEIEASLLAGCGLGVKARASDAPSVLAALNTSIAEAREKIAAEKRRQAEEAAKLQAEEAERQRQAEIEEAKKSMKGLRGEARQDVKSKIEAMQDAPVPTASSIADAVESQVRQSFRGGGRAATRSKWVVTDVDLPTVIAAVVASSEELRDMVEVFRTSGTVRHVPVSVLSANRGELQRLLNASPDHAPRIPGVEAELDRRIANT